MKKWLALLLCLLLGLTACSPAGAKTERKWEIAVVTQDASSTEAEALEAGVKAYNEAHDTINAYQDMQQYPPELQVPLVEDLIAQEVDAICVLPADPEALAPMVKKARNRGIVVVVCGAPELADAACDLEPGTDWSWELIGQTMVALAAQLLEGQPLGTPDVEGCPPLQIREGKTLIVEPIGE